MDNKIKLTDTFVGVEARVINFLPIILDACCGGRMFWYDKENENTIYADKRNIDKGAFSNNWNPNWCIKPDVTYDFREMPFADKF